MLSPIASEDLDPTGRGYPRPQLRRSSWCSLNGEWAFALDLNGRWNAPADVAWAGPINVPFSPEAPLSGIDFRGFFRAGWYRRQIELPENAGTRWILHF